MAQPAFEPSVFYIHKIIRFMKYFYEKDPSAKTEDMIHKIFVQLNIHLLTDEFQFGQRIFRMIDGYFSLGRRIGHPSKYNEQQNSWVLDECPYFAELHEVLHVSNYYRNLIAEISTKPTTSSASPLDTVSDGTTSSSNDNNDQHQLTESTSSGYEADVESSQSQA